MKKIFYTCLQNGLMALLTMLVFNSCQKEINGDIDTTPVPTGNEKPKVGTVWTYRYNTYYGFAGGGIRTTSILKFRAKSEDVFAGENWLTIVDMARDTIVFILNQKAGGLYQYANNSSNLLCKDPAAIGDTYTSFHDSSSEDFIVRGVKDVLPTGIGTIPVNYYEGVKSAHVIDQILYNENAWIVRKQYYLYKVNGSLLTYYVYSTLFLESIDY